jgi:hypothetical protein
MLASFPITMGMSKKISRKSSWYLLGLSLSIFLSPFPFPLSFIPYPLSLSITPFIFITIVAYLSPVQVAWRKI